MLSSGGKHFYLPNFPLVLGLDHTYHKIFESKTEAVMLIHSFIQQNTTCSEHLHVPDPHLVAEDRVVQGKYGPCPVGAFILIEIQYLYVFPKTNMVL